MSSIAADRAAASSSGAVAAESAQILAVQLASVTKTFGEIYALKDTSLAVRRGELVTLLGPSGCGKTTMLNLIAGFLQPDCGEIAIDGRRVNDVATYRRQIGMMFQNYALFPHMTVADNVGYGLRMRGVSKSEIRDRVAKALVLVKLAGVEDRRPQHLSGGQQQRVALARALVINPKVLLLDEPFSALDRNLRAAMQVEVKEIQRQLGVTTIFVTHDQSEALSISDRIAVIFEGRIHQLGTPDEIYRRPVDRLVASFVGDVNILSARLDDVRDADARLTLGAASIKVAKDPLAGAQPGDMVDLFVRPEQLQLVPDSEPYAVQGRVATRIYQGGHVDLHIDVAEAQSGRVLVRLASNEAAKSWPVAARVKIAVAGGDTIAFARAQIR
jgi:putative spermidine/putrescine transport system ATP-binding protein